MINLIYSLLVSALLMLPAIAANSEKDYRDNVQWAKDTINKNQNKTGFTGFDINSLCKDAACQQGVANPVESRYYDNPSAMNSAKMQGMSTDSQAQSVTTSFNKGRPTIDENDPAYRSAVGYQNDAYNISHGISSKYHDCEKGLVCEVDSQPRSCTLPTNNPVQCYLTPFVKSTSITTKEYDFLLSNASLPYTLELEELVTLSSVRISSSLSISQYTTALRFYINGNLLGETTLKPEKCSNMTCTAQINSQFTYPASNESSSYVLKIYSSFIGDFGYEYTLIDNMKVTLVAKKTSVEVGYNNSCGAILPECQKVQAQCIEGKETRMINGLNVTLDCWNEQTTYQCAFPNNCEAISDCRIESTSCDTQLGGVCIKDKQQRACETSLCRDTGLICGADNFSLSGDYYDPAATRGTDFERAAAGLSAISDAASDLKDKTNINADSAIIFKGTVMECSKKAVGLSNCCKDGGWGNDVGLTSCSEGEKALRTAKEEKLTISLGEYCAERVLGVCINEKKAYCSFDSKLARIVQQEGRVQLGKSFGSAKNPDCSALSPNELQRIDMSSMDFSDFYEDMYNAIELPSTDEIQKRLQQSVGGTKP